MRFEKRTRIEAPAGVVFGFHEEPDAIARLIPPWEPVEVVEPPRSLAVGTRVVLRGRAGPFRKRVVAEHVAYVPGRMFEDQLVEGPFRSFRHKHIILPDGPRAAFLHDVIDYELPLGRLGQALVGRLVERRLERMFAFRHDVTRAVCEARARAADDVEAAG